jgi:DNA-binding transcriptional LysR family regulator
MDRIEIREIECFVAVAENLSFSKAARQLHMTQPPLSRQIRKLEGKLQSSLLLRNNQRVELTKEGQVFYEEAISLLLHADRVVHTVQLARADKVEIFNVGFLGALLNDEMVELLKRLQTQLPKCQVRTQEIPLFAVEASLQSGELDGAFIASAQDIRGDGLGMLQWRIPSYKVLLPSSHRMAHQDQVQLKELADENWVMISRRSSPSFRKHLTEACLKEGFHPKITHESDRLSAILVMVALGEGIGLVPHSQLTIALPGLVLKPLTGWSPKIEHTFVYRKDRELPALEVFRRILREAMKAREKRRRK